MTVHTLGSITSICAGFSLLSSIPITKGTTYKEKIIGGKVDKNEIVGLEGKKNENS